MDKFSINNLIILFVIGIIGVIGIGIVASQITTKTSQIGVVDESISIATARLAGNNVNESKQFTVTNNPTSWKLDGTDCDILNVVLTNASGTTLLGNFTFTANTGVFTMANNTYMVTGGGANNGTLIDYSYCANDYMNSTFGRTGLNLIGGIFALFLLVIFVAGVYKLIQNTKED